VIDPHKLRRKLVVRITDPASIRKLELVQVRQIPARERDIDRFRQLLEAVTGANDQHPTRTRIADDPPTALKLDPDLQPRPRHRGRRLAANPKGLRDSLWSSRENCCGSGSETARRPLS